MTGYLAVDLGASSGRVVLGVLDGDRRRVTLREVHRFAHRPVPTPAGPVWDLTGLWAGVLDGLRLGGAAAEDACVTVASVGVATWSVDGVFIGPGGDLLGLPHTYRDPAHVAAMPIVFDRLEGGVGELYDRVGIQPIPLDTIFQWAAKHARDPGLFRDDATFLMLPDLFHFWLGGRPAVERTNASSTAMLSAATGDWDRELLDRLGLPHATLGQIVEPGTTLGTLRPELAGELGLSPEVRIVAPATHDTASAIAAVPATAADGDGWAYLSSGTWSLLGVELDRPLVTREALAAPFTNELGVGGKVRFLKNITGLWLFEELRRDLAGRNESYEFGGLCDTASAAEPFRTVIDPDTPSLAEPGGSIEKLRAVADGCGEPIPETVGQLARCCLDSLALSYADTLAKLEAVTGRTIDLIHVVGGGTRNAVLNRLTADATGRAVVVGPSEATALGNVLVQAMGLGEVADLPALREIVAGSVEPRRVEPDPAAAPSDAVRDRFSACVGVERSR